jgi:hypothetical protein
LSSTRQRSFLAALIERIELQADRMDIRLRPTQLGAFLDLATPLPSATDDETRILSVPVRLRRCGREMKMLINGTGPFAAAKPDARLIKLLIRAHRFNATLIGSAAYPTFKDATGKLFAAVAAGSPTGFWRMSGHPAVQQALRNHHFDSLGLPRLYVPHAA